MQSGSQAFQQLRPALSRSKFVDELQDALHVSVRLEDLKGRRRLKALERTVLLALAVWVAPENPQIFEEFRGRTFYLLQIKQRPQRKLLPEVGARWIAHAHSSKHPVIGPWHLFIERIRLQCKHGGAPVGRS